MDKFSSQNPPSCASILITVSVGDKPDIVAEIKYRVPFRGVISDMKNITIMRSISNNDDAAGMSKLIDTLK